MAAIDDIQNLFLDISEEQYSNYNISNLMIITENNNSVVIVKYSDGTEERLTTIEEIKTLVDNITKA